MFHINQDDKSVHLTRGDVAVLEIGTLKADKEPYIFKVGDVVRLTVTEKKRYDLVVLVKDITVENESELVYITLEKNDTKLGEIIHKPKDYWYEIELNPDTIPQTIIGHDLEGPKVFRLYPEGDDR